MGVMGPARAMTVTGLLTLTIGLTHLIQSLCSMKEAISMTTLVKMLESLASK